jgi:hypothetical protein
MQFRIEATTTGFKIRSVRVNTKGKEVTRIIGTTNDESAIDSIIERYESTMR